jgi:arginase family enzyme
MTDTVYITIDVDVFDQVSCRRYAGARRLGWYQVMQLLLLYRSQTIVGLMLLICPQSLKLDFLAIN